MPHARTSLTLWGRLAVAWAFVAILSGLIAPASMLAKDVQTGKLAGLCSVASPFAGADTGDGPSPEPHCDWCGATAIAGPPLAEFVIPSFPGTRVTADHFPSEKAAALVGLPFNRGPPAA